MTAATTRTWGESIETMSILNYRKFKTCNPDEWSRFCVCLATLQFIEATIPAFEALLSSTDQAAVSLDEEMLMAWTAKAKCNQGIFIYFYTVILDTELTKTIGMGGSGWGIRFLGKIVPVQMNFV